MKKRHDISLASTPSRHSAGVRSPSTTIRTGFTLVDLVISVLIIGIMAAVTVPRFIDTLHRYRAESAAERVLVDLDLARKNAMAASADRTVRFSVNSYELVGMSDPNRSSAAYVVDLAASPYRCAIIADDFGGDNVLIFDGYGKPDSGGTVVVSSGGYQITVLVDPETGKATIP